MALILKKKRIWSSYFDEDRKVATPYTTIIKKYLEFLIKIKKIVIENNIKGIVIGNPINMDGSPSPSSQSAKDLAISLSKDITKNITLWDERLSSEGAFNLFSNLDINVSKSQT